MADVAIWSNASEIARRVQSYRNGLRARIEAFLGSLATVGISAIDRQIMIAESFYSLNDEPVDAQSFSTEVRLVGEDRYRITIGMSGEDVAFIEFSAGITHGTAPGAFSPLPSGKDYGNGMGYGTYNPSSGNATNPNGWWYTDEGGESKHTYGGPAFHPMLSAEIDIMQWLSTAAALAFAY